MLVTYNAYLVLWLHSDATEKQINKRYKEMLNLLEIDEIPEYDIDFPFLNYKRIRKEEHIKWAFSQLTNQKRKIYQSFFWFDIVDKIDERAFELFTKWEVLEALEIWKDQYSEKLKGHYLKNYLVWDLLLLENCKVFEGELDFKRDITIIAKGYKEIIDSESFWKEFEKIYNLNNEIQITKEQLTTLRNELPQYMVEAVFDISEDIKKQNFYKKFSTVFWLVAQELDDNKNVTKEIDLIKNKFDEIKDLDLDWEDFDTIVEWLNDIEWAINRLENLWLWENPKLKKLRDKVANEIISIAIKLANDYWKYDECDDFMDRALRIASWTVIKHKIEDNKKTLIWLKWKAKVDKIWVKIEKVLKDLKNVISINDVRDAHKTLKKYLAEVKSEWSQEDFNWISDIIAITFYSTALYFNNDKNEYVNAYEVIGMAEYYAVGHDVKQKIRLNKETILWNITNSGYWGGYSNNNSYSNNSYSSSWSSWGSNSWWSWAAWAWIIGIIIVFCLIANCSGGSSKSSSSYSNSSSSSSYTQTYEKNWQCKWSDWDWHDKPVHWYCDNASTPLGWKCNAWYTATSENNQTWKNSSWYCKANCAQVTCYWTNNCKQPPSPSSVNRYDSLEVDLYNILVESYNRCLSENCYCA